MELKRFVVGSLDTNAYVVYDKDSLKGCIIDPGDNGKVISNFIDQKEISLESIVLTHCHYDHIGAVQYLKDKYKSKVYIHELDEEGLTSSEINRSKYHNKKIQFKGHIRLKEKDIINIGPIKMEVIHTPGHTPGSICLYIKKEKVIFTGDTIFDTDIGRMDLPGGSVKDMAYSLDKLDKKLNDEVTIYPGHDVSATMEYVRKHNREFHQYKK
ncbi:MAG: MBL fold metallo-hydrolase [Anaeromicrobium sp.]|jgi:glyoxylase-like metal-dependent hydrolase (beta-lactamase superfamily II)|uniref:MBL fold metallo-hydrolase n=1 Tax=Anaeromicrobium sp. TaxID=1929132 RepID=UPI0025D8C1C9|nr:MBL fold metallo-hydrolase [Anaeromicrobium sp.]MCT4595536.1 MBL fold metallo-hydrolase [Anaeromicrobium sp.]